MIADLRAESSGRAFVLVHDLGSASSAELAEACRRAGVSTVGCTSASEVTGLEDIPRFVIARVRRGERRIRQEVLDIMSRLSVKTPLLLLCDEPLVRPRVRLHGDRVTLLGRPLSTARLYGEIRMQLAATVPSLGLDEEASLRERCVPEWWAADLAFAPTDESPRARPVVKCHAENALTVLVPLSSDAPQPTSEIERAFEILSSCDAERWPGAELCDVLQERAGLLHLTRRAKDWLVYWPTSKAPLWLFSPLRLPNLSEWGRGSKETSKVHRIAAFHGDLAVALSTEVSGLADAEARSPSLRSLLTEGGPAVLQHLLGVLRSSVDPVAGIVAEVR